VFSVVVLLAVVVFSVIGGSSQQSQPQVDLIGTGHSVRFSESKISVHDDAGNCPGQQDALYWLNETGTAQQVVQIGGQPFDFGVILPAAAEAIGECEPPGNYVYSLKSSPTARLVVTARQN
jgi:hypothetical protein